MAYIQTRRSISLPAEVYKKIRNLADAEGVSMSKWLEHAVRTHIDAVEAEAAQGKQLRQSEEKP